MRRIKAFALALVLIIGLSGIATTPVTITGHSDVLYVEAKKKKLTQKQCYKKLVRWLKKHGNTWIEDEDLHSVLDHREGNWYIYHFYYEGDDMTWTMGWYAVNRKTGKVKDYLSEGEL